jgi:hypothetical protein
MLSELETQNRTEDRQSFVLAAWHGVEPAGLLSLAEGAGLTGEEADELVNRIGRAKEQVDQVNRLGRLRREADAAESHLDKVQARATAETERLQNQVEEASFAASVARKAVYAAEESSRQLLAMHDEGLLPLTVGPKEVFCLIQRRAAEENSHQCDVARVAAFEERNRCRAIAGNIQERLANLPITLTSPNDESILQDRLKEAKRQLADAESRLKKAEAVAAAARRAIK